MLADSFMIASKNAPNVFFFLLFALALVFNQERATNAWNALFLPIAIIIIILISTSSCAWGVQGVAWTYGDLDAVVGKDQGRVGHSKLGGRHGGRCWTRVEGVSKGIAGE